MAIKIKNKSIKERLEPVAEDTTGETNSHTESGVANSSAAEEIVV
jgi:hypothetical protein